MAGEVCEHPENCSAIIHNKIQIEQVHNDYEKSRESLENNTKELTQTNFNLAELSNDVKHLCKTFEKSEKDNKEEHNTFFGRTRNEETTRIEQIGTLKTSVEKKLSDIKVSQAVKLSTWDLIKIISAVGVLFGLFSYFGK